jgi:tellurite resistance protein
LADGQRDAHEDHELRVMTGLLGLTAVQSAEARQRASIP